MPINTRKLDLGGGSTSVAFLTTDNNVGWFRIELAPDFGIVRFIGGRVATNGESLTVGGEILPGDMNCDGLVNLLDVTPFVDALAGTKFNPKADIDQDGSVDLLDVAPFIVLLSGG